MELPAVSQSEAKHPRGRTQQSDDCPQPFPHSNSSSKLAHYLRSMKRIIFIDSTAFTA